MSQLVLTRSSWLNCALQDDEAVYWVSKGSNGWYLVVLSQYEVIIDVTGSAECTYAFIHWKKWKSSGVTDP